MIEAPPMPASPTLASPRPQPRGPCDNCGCLEGSILFYNQDYISGETFGILQCAQCQLARTALAPETDLQPYYGPAYYGEAARRFHPLIERAIAGFRNQRANLITHLRPTPGRILDIGCGRGLMLAELKRRGWESVGTEQSADLARTIGQQTGLSVRAGETLAACKFEADEFDVVTLWHVLEHLAYPIQTLREIQRILKPGGVVVIEVPNLHSWQAHLGGGVWFHLDTPRHLYHFSADQLSQRLSQHGFHLMHRHTFSLEYGPYGMCQTLLNRLTQTPNVLYRLLKRATSQSAHQPALGARDLAITVAGAIPAALLAAGLEIASLPFNKGGIIRLVAQKTSYAP